MRIKRTLIFFIVVSFLYGTATFAHDGFNTNNVYKITSELSESKYRGRLAGDIGNVLASHYISTYFKNIGLKPAFNNSFFQYFSIYVPTFEGNSYLGVIDRHGNMIKSYIYGKDFKEITYGDVSSGLVEGSVRTGSIKGNILMLKNGETGESRRDYNDDKNLLKNGISAVIYETNRELRFRSPYKLQIPQEKGIVKFMVNEDAYREILDYAGKGYSIKLKSSLVIKKVLVSNIVGILEGSNKNLPPIVLSSHFDHVGFDADGTVYPGALDNASGTAFLLECARTLKNSSRERTIIFAAFNAEEEGLLGSEYFVKHPPMDITKAECVNFDMVASSKDLPLTILSSSSTIKYTNDISKLMRSSFIKSNIRYEDNSDHASFCHSGIDAVTFIYYDHDKIHTPEDTLKNVDKKKFIEVFNALSSYLRTKDVILIPASTDQSKSTDYSQYIIPGILLIILSGAVYIFIKKRAMIIYKKKR